MLRPNNNRLYRRRSVSRIVENYLWSIHSDISTTSTRRVITKFKTNQPCTVVKLGLNQSCSSYLSRDNKAICLFSKKKKKKKVYFPLFRHKLKSFFRPFSFSDNRLALSDIFNCYRRNKLAVKKCPLINKNTSIYVRKGL